MQRSYREASEALARVRESKPKTSTGLWAKQDAVHRLERDAFEAYQAERRQLGEQEACNFLRLANPEC